MCVLSTCVRLQINLFIFLLKVVTRLGTIIEPISKEATFKKEKEKSGFLVKDGGKRKLDIVGKKQPVGKKTRGQRGGKRKK